MLGSMDVATESATDSVAMIQVCPRVVVDHCEVQRQTGTELLESVSTA